MHCPYCGSNHTGIKEYLGNKNRYQCFDCKKTWTKSEKADPSSSKIPNIITEADGPNLNIVSKSTDIRTLEQLLAYTRVDLSIWEVQKHTVNMWGNEDNPNFQVKAWLKKRDDTVNMRDEIEEFKADAKKYAPKYPKIKYEKKDSGNLLEISIFDHHFGQLSWGDETGGSHYDIKIAERLALDAVSSVLSDAAHYNIERILLPVGNDFFNVNGMLNTTVAGTPQSEDDRWKKTFTNGRRLWVKIIEMCMQVAPVDVLIIPGNHDEERVYYLGETLYAWFNNCEDVSVDNGPHNRKIYEWGKCAIGFTHGDKEVKGTLVNIMSTTWPMIWARTKYREWHKGHLHAAKAHAFQILDEFHGVREWVLPSLVALDDWHAGKGYSALRQTMAMIWNKERGNRHIITYRPREEDKAA